MTTKVFPIIPGKFHYPYQPPPLQSTHDFYMKNNQKIEELIQQNHLTSENLWQWEEIVEAGFGIRKDTSTESNPGFAVGEESTESNSTWTIPSPLRKATIPPHCREEISCCNRNNESYKIITCSKPWMFFLENSIWTHSFGIVTRPLRCT